MVADGMSFGTLTLGELASRERRSAHSEWTKLWSRSGVRRAAMTTFSADGFVTDSAAGASAWGIGVHINNGAVNVTPEGRQLTPLFAHARQNARATGLVTTTRVTHATPAGFIANVPRRDMEDAIAEQMLERRVDVLLGGGARHFKDSMLAGAPDVSVVRDRDALLAQGVTPAAGRLLGLFAPSHIPFALERPPTVPRLAEMTRAALARLGAAPEGFVLQIEGGRVDHAAHSNDAAALVGEQLDFDDAIASVLAFVENRDDTLVIVTTDHGNANPGLTYYGKPGKERFAKLPRITRSFDWVDEEFARISPGKKPDLGAISAAAPAIIAGMTDLPIPGAEIEMLQRVIRGERVMPMLEANKWSSVLGQIFAEQVGIAFTSPNHTSDMVEVTAFGPGSESLPMFVDNIDLHGLMVSALGFAPAKELPGNDEILKPVRPPKDD